MVTKEQFKAYRRVQELGHYNMFDRRAIEETGLDKETYFEIIKNYSKYYKMYEE